VGVDQFSRLYGKKTSKLQFVTDGDGSMREAIKEVFPSTRHRLCTWHLNKNAVDNLKNSTFWMVLKKQCTIILRRRNLKSFRVSW